MQFFETSNLNDISNLRINFNPDGWGPISGEKAAPLSQQVPYAHFDKKDKVGRTADFVFQQYQQQQQSQNQNSYFAQKQLYQARRREEQLAALGTTDFSYKHDAAEDSTFQLIAAKAAWLGASKAVGVGPEGAGEGEVLLSSRMGSLPKHERKLDRLPSLAVSGDWEMIEEFDLVHLLKLVANTPATEDLEWHGHIDKYDESYDKLTTRIAKGLKRAENKMFYDVTTKEDPIIEKLAVDNTDSIIAQLMAAPRSVYSWDIVVQKVNGMIFLDKRDNSSFDYLTINQPDKLSLEATMINQNFTQQVLLLDENDSRKTYEPNPFFDETEVSVEPASAAYRYRKFTLGSALLAGAHQLKLGYVSRVAPNNPYEHVVLGTQSFKPKDLAQQINLSVNNIWGIVKMICELLMSKSDGKYVLLKDPNKPIVRLYKVPLGTFEDDEEEGEADEEEEEDEEDEQDVPESEPVDVSY
eukprot:gene28544-37502_t